jgi:hypothetical protein
MSSGQELGIHHLVDARSRNVVILKVNRRFGNDGIFGGTGRTARCRCGATTVSRSSSASAVTMRPSSVPEIKHGPGHLSMYDESPFSLC